MAGGFENYRLIPTTSAVAVVEDQPKQVDPNPTTSFYLAATQRYLWGYAGTGLSAVGLLGNGLSIAVLRSPHMASSTSDYLAALAVADAITLLLFSACMGLPLVSQSYRHLVGPDSALITALYPLSLFVQMCGTYITACFTVERCLSVMFPLRFNPLGSNRVRSKRALACVAAFCLVYNLPRALETVRLGSPDSASPHTSANDSGAVAAAATWTLRSSLWYNRIYSGLLYTMFMYALPMSVIATANALLIRAVRAAVDHPSQRRPQSDDGETPADQHIERNELINSRERIKRQEREHSISLMLASVVSVFIFCQTFCLVDNLLAVALYPSAPSAAHQALYIVAQFLVVINSSVNFLFFCFYGEKFRRELRHLLGGGSRRRFDGGSSSGGSRWRVAVASSRLNGGAVGRHRGSRRLGLSYSGYRLQAPLASDMVAAAGVAGRSSIAMSRFGGGAAVSVARANSLRPQGSV